MRCLICKHLSPTLICKKCQEIFLMPSFYQRDIMLDKNEIIKVYSFYKYEEIKELINLKYEPIGNQIFEILANLSLKIFIQNFDYPYKVLLVPIDDNIKPSANYSHTAILAKNMKFKNKQPIYAKLRSKNHIKYAGKSLQFRQKNNKNFLCKLHNQDIILIDDIITTGSTIIQAYTTCKKNNNNILFALTLCDANL